MVWWVGEESVRWRSSIDEDEIGCGYGLWMGAGEPVVQIGFGCGYGLRKGAEEPVVQIGFGCGDGLVGRRGIHIGRVGQS